MCRRELLCRSGGSRGGAFGVYLESRGDKFPYRMKIRATGLPLVSAMEEYVPQRKNCRLNCLLVETGD